MTNKELREIDAQIAERVYGGTEYDFVRFTSSTAAAFAALDRVCDERGWVYDVQRNVSCSALFGIGKTAIPK